MARLKPTQDPDAAALGDAVSALPAAGGSYSAEDTGAIRQTEGLAEATPAARRGFGAATPADIPQEP